MARYVVTNEIATMAESAGKDVFASPGVRLLFMVAFGFQLLRGLPLFLSGNVPPNAWVVLGATAAFLGYSHWRAFKKKQEWRKSVIGQEVVVEFREDGIDYTLGGSRQVLRYANIARAGRDERGLVLIADRIGELWIPTTAFASAQQRDSVFTYLGQFLHKR